MKKVFGLTLMVAVVLSLVGCGQTKATTTTETITTEVVTEATTKETPTTEAPTTEATVTETVTTEESTNDAVPDDPKKSKENIVITEGLDPSFAISTVREKTDNRWIIGYCGDTVFAVIIGNEGEEHIDVNLESELETSSIMFMFSEEVADTSLYHESLYSGVQAITDGVLDFTVEFKDGKTVNITVHVPES